MATSLAPDPARRPRHPNLLPAAAVPTGGLASHATGTWLREAVAKESGRAGASEAPRPAALPLSRLLVSPNGSAG